MRWPYSKPAGCSPVCPADRSPHGCLQHAAAAAAEAPAPTPAAAPAAAASAAAAAAAAAGEDAAAAVVVLGSWQPADAGAGLLTPCDLQQSGVDPRKPRHDRPWTGGGRRTRSAGRPASAADRHGRLQRDRARPGRPPGAATPAVPPASLDPHPAADPELAPVSRVYACHMQHGKL